MLQNLKLEIKRDEGISNLGRNKEEESKLHKLFHLLIHLPAELICKVTIPISDPKQWNKPIAVV